jgi:hypothetical protein
MTGAAGAHTAAVTGCSPFCSNLKVIVNISYFFAGAKISLYQTKGFCFLLRLDYLGW